MFASTAIPSSNRPAKQGGPGRAGARRAVLLAAVLGSASPLSAAPYTIDWMNMSPWIINNSGGPQIPTGSTFFLAGVGNVTVTFTQTPPQFSSYRFQSAAFIAGSVNPGPDTYSWTNHEGLSRTNFNTTGTTDNWTITYSFTSPVAAGSLALGVFGLGRIDLAVPGNITTATVAQNGTFLGDWGVSTNLGPTQFNGASGSFSMQNSLPGDLTPGNPAFNTALGVVRIDDQISSLTVDFAQIGQDGVGVNIGYISPAPGSAALLGAAGLAVARRRRS